MSLLSPKMASKRPSAGDTIFPPKKRALYEHMKLHGIDKFSTNHITANGILDYKENFGTYGMKIPVNIEIAQSENFSRARSDSLHSQLSSNSDNTENGSAGSRETSPCTIQSMFDHHTPERNPITSLDGLKPDISKPLFPPSDSDNSMVGSDGNLSPDNSLFGEQGETKSDKNERQVNKIAYEQQTDFNSIPENNVKTFHENEVRKNYSFQKEIIPEIEREELTKNGNSSIEQTRNDVYMGPMVSLLNRFNAEAAQNNMDMKMKEQLSLQEMRNVLPPNSLIRPNVILNYSQQQFEALHHIQNSVKTQSMLNKINKVPSEKKSCHLCNKEFTSRANLHNHLKTHENKSIPCWVCKEMFQTAENLNAHMKIEHKGENPYKCEHCSREFTQFNNLRRHMRVHREKVFKCNLCNREFNEEFYLKMHMGTHTGKRVYSCGVCGAGFPSSHDLKMHVKTHSPSLLHTCDVCGKSFSKACVLRQHKKGHSGERPHKCDKCEKTFIHRHHLTMHMKSHVDEKRLSCDICQKEFSQHSHLYKHLRAHEDMKKFDVDLESVRKKSVKKKDVSKGHDIIAKSVLKVVLNQDNVSSNDREFVRRDRQVISDTNVIQTTGRTPKQHRNNISQNSQVQPSYSVSMSSTFSDNSKSLPSMSQTFGHQMSRYPSMPYGQRIPPNYLPGSQAQQFSPLYNPLLRNRVPAPLHGFQPYNQLYRNYSEQVQTYYNNMYMMKYLSQNALLQNAQGEGQNFKNLEDFQLPKQNETTNMQSVEESPGLLQPKIIKGIESLGNEQVSYENDENSQRESGIENTVSENEGNGDLDVVNEVGENVIEESQDMGRDFEVGPKGDVVMSEEHEVAQELLKMSAGTKMIDSDGNSSKLFGKGEIQETDSKPNGLKFRHCISDIIERTVRNGNKLSENAHVSKSQNIMTQNFSPYDSVSRSNEHFQVTIPKTIDQPFQAENSANAYVRYSSGHERETEQDMNLEPTDMNRISESQTSPLQKLKMFVASEEKDFNRNVSVIDDGRKYNSAFHSYAADKVQERLESMHEEKTFEEKPDGDLLETGENIVRVIEASNEEVRETESETFKSVEDSLEVRLEKIRQFADIGKRFGKSDSENEVVENGESEGTVEHIEGKEDSVVDSGNEAREIENESVEIKEDKPVVVVLVDTVDNAGYFDDSLEDRQLEIVENSIAKGEENDKLEDQGDNRTSEQVETNNGGLNISTGEGYVFTENEFLSHITQMNDVVENGKGNVKATDKAKEEINERNETDCETVEHVTVDEDENLIGQVKSQQLNEKHNCVNLNNSVKEHLNEVDFEKCRTEQFERRFDGNTAENEAVDLRTEIRSDESKINEVSFNESDASRNVELENLPMDLSMSGMQRKCELGNQVDRSGGSRDGICHSRNSKVGSPASLICGLCWRTFASVHELELHQIEHAKSIGNHCSICKKSFTGAFELQCHILKHKDLSTFIQNKGKLHSDKPERGEKIEISFSGQKEHVEHLHNLQVDRRQSHEFSNSEMNQSGEISQSSEMGEKKYCCQFCDKTFDQSEEWVEHVNTHNASDKPYVCNICRRAFTHRHNLNRHKMSHNSKSYECNVCKRSFKESFYLQMHMKIHDEENFHKCQICGQNVRKSEIWQHTSQHLGNMSDNPTYHQIGNRVQQILHEQNVNPNDEKAGVNSRSKQFNIPDETGKGEDMRKIKADKLGVSDPQGDKALNLKKENIENWNVQRNAKIDQYDPYNVFRVKDNALKSASVLTERRSEDGYRNSGGNSSYECHICKTVLRTKHELENHMGIHSGLRPHVCKTCGRAFKKSKGLRTHEKLHLEPSLQV